MKNFKKIIAIVLCIISLMSVFSVEAFAASYDANTVVSLANKYVGSSWKKGYCLNFVATMFQKAYGTSYSSANCAYEYGTKYLDSTSQSNIPLGADVFFTGSTSTCGNCGKKCGHIGIYVGDGKLVHAWDGKIVKTSITSITKSGTYKYRGWGMHGNMSLKNTSTSTQASTLKTGTWYRISNNRSGRLLNVYGSKNASGTNVTVFSRDDTSGEDFKLSAHGTMTYNGKTYTKYVIIPRCAQSCALNIYGYNAKNGANVNIWSKSGNKTQDWIFEAVNGGYVIRSADNPVYVLTASGTSNSSNVKVATYSAGNAYQIWKLS